jgi:hypothetical protein
MTEVRELYSHKQSPFRACLSDFGVFRAASAQPLATMAFLATKCCWLFFWRTHSNSTVKVAQLVQSRRISNAIAIG